jgi:hypothetical protein
VLPFRSHRHNKQPADVSFLTISNRMCRLAGWAPPRPYLLAGYYWLGRPYCNHRQALRASHLARVMECWEGGIATASFLPS